MITKEDVERFLRSMKNKIEIFGIRYRDDREKNLQALLDLGIRPNDRTNIVKQLQAEDYSSGPVTDTLNKGNDLWIFGKYIKESEIYIKITLGFPNNNVVCISFHIAEKPMSYPFKEKEK
ncbi:MAG: toxin [Bacteroidales bacterium]|jgi:hypothetical protein|nr:toxin [Bacteroidales bacterium]